ncbi:hypothetical protein O988_05884 [Pseudogymnoascus sp. VKM F-3808]|nr:hypothetical protein O988_05884 [Pseudogymnoascus sp. VKM F-3808]
MRNGFAEVRHDSIRTALGSISDSKPVSKSSPYLTGRYGSTAHPTARTIRYDPLHYYHHTTPYAAQGTTEPPTASAAQLTDRRLDISHPPAAYYLACLDQQ